MGYHHLLLSLAPAPPISLLPSRCPRGGDTGRAFTALSASSNAAQSSAVSKEVATRRRTVLLVGVSVLPLLGLRDAAAQVTRAQRSTVDLVTGEL
jgi:hypothetical protein